MIIGVKSRKSFSKRRRKEEKRKIKGVKGGKEIN
jgi:hypothetical protein